MLNSFSSFIPLTEPNLAGNEKIYLCSCIDDNWVSSAGSYVEKFEKQIALVAGTKYAVACCNGTVAIKLALLAANVKRDQRVILPDWTFVATANAIVDIGAVPVFVDVEPDNYTLCRDSLKSALHKYDNIGAIIGVHPLGYSCDIGKLKELAKPMSIPVIEDAAGAIGAKYGHLSVGCIGDFGCFSFNGNKVITAGAGGAIVSNNSEGISWIRHYISQARVSSDYRHDKIGFNYRMSNLNAAVGVAQVERLQEILGCKAKIALRYDSVLSKFANGPIKKMPQPRWGVGNNWLYSVLADSEAVADSLIAHLEQENIEARKFWRNLTSLTPFRKYESEEPRVAESLSGRVVSLPSSSGISTSELDRVVDCLDTFLSK